jgi:peptidoglycan/xylan/chitin deacetylase (PgdA/CDA1 family)
VHILKELRLPAAFFVSSGFVGLSTEDEDEFMKSRLYIKLGTEKTTGGLSFEDVRKIVEEGFTVGGHTVNHCNLTQLRAKDQVNFEISEDKRRLETITGKRIEYFSYPGGNYFNPVINLQDVLKEAGYIAAVTTVSGFNNVVSNPYMLRRELTGASMPAPVFRARVYGNYDPVRCIKEKIHKIKGL